jgi:hypothetical protein
MQEKHYKNEGVHAQSVESGGTQRVFTHSVIASFDKDIV